MLRYRPEALADIRSIALHISEDSPTAAIRWRDGILKRCRFLAEMPGLGTSRHDVMAGLRVFPVRNYLILYLELRRGVEILRIMHGARDWQKSLDD